MSAQRYYLDEVTEKIGVSHEFLVQCIRAHWVIPAGGGVDASLDEEDVARARLIHELMDDLGANPESIPIILHLLDQLYLSRLP